MRALVILLLTVFWMKAMAQLNPMPTIYFFNPYEVNPSMAGARGGYEVNGAVKAQWTAIEGAPYMQSVTVSGATTNKRVGAGLNFYHEKAGLINVTSIRASYAFHLPLDSYGNTLDLGLSLGMGSERLDLAAARGDLDDEVLQTYNQRPAYVDGDFGAAYRYEGLMIQAVVPNLRKLLKDANTLSYADRFLYMGSVSYLFDLPADRDIEVEPMLMYRRVKGYRSLWDGGLRIHFEQRKLNGFLIYHSTGSITGGIGTTYAGQLGIQVSYTSNGRAISKDGNGEFSLALKYSFGRDREQ